MLDRRLLFYFVQDALRNYSEDYRLIDRENNPIQLRLNGEMYSIYLSYVHDSGNHRDNDDEVRIQIQRSIIEEQKRRHMRGQHIAFVGFFPEGNAFIGWDPRYVLSLSAKTTVSVYARHSQKDMVRVQSASVHSFKPRFLPKETFAIALPSSALGFYLENITSFHQLESEEAIRRLIHNYNNRFLEGVGEIDGNIEIEDAGKRERFTYIRSAYPRDPYFKESVLEAYNRACCICGRQLAIIQAAHIIPHSIPESPNTVINGLALCIEHHRFYDDALLLPGPDYKLVFNRERAEYLRQIEQEKGLDEIAAQDGKQFAIPSRVQLRPSTSYLQKGLEIRLGSGSH